MHLRATHRDAGQSTVVDLSGKITLGEGSALLRKTVRGLLDDKRTHIVLNLADVDYIDSSGIDVVHVGEVEHNVSALIVQESADSLAEQGAALSQGDLAA